MRLRRRVVLPHEAEFHGVWYDCLLYSIRKEQNRSMKTAIHQPHYFPWLGYFDIMAKADIFILMDEVQMERRSYMIRNRVLDTKGEIKYITISADTQGFLEKQYREIPVKDTDVWTARQKSVLKEYYRWAKHRDEILPVVNAFLENRYETVCQWTCASIQLIAGLLEIKTPLVYQSALDYDRESKKSDLVLALCKAVGADISFTGRGGSMEYLDREAFAANGVTPCFQDFKHPVYPQCSGGEFVPGISVLDMLFNCGVEESRRIFWETVKSAHEFEQIEA